MSVDQVLDLVERDRPFYQRSGGGITLSGGEPAAQPEFAIALLRACKDSQILTAIETSGCCDWEILDALLPHLDLVLLDIKHTDPDLHRDLTGVSNQLILSNARRLAKSDTPLQLRTPVIPGYTDDPKNLRSLYQLAADLDVDVQLVPYHGLGIAKYASLGRRYRLTKLRPPSPEYLDRIRSDYGKAVVGLA
jgi:pyruvate formate lyase activating enzyme